MLARFKLMGMILWQLCWNTREFCSAQTVTLEEELKDVLMTLERKSVCQASLEIDLRNVVKVREELSEEVSNLKKERQEIKEERKKHEEEKETMNEIIKNL